MEGVCKLLLKNLYAGRRIRRDVGISSGDVGGRLIDVGKEGVDGFTDRIGTAEQSNYAAFRLRVFHLLAAAFLYLTLSTTGRKQRTVLPVRVEREKNIRVKPFALHLFTDILTI